MENLEKLNLQFPDHPDLNKRICFFLEAMSQEDYDGILLLTYPAIFEVVSRQLMREKVQSTFDGDETSIAIDSFEVDSIGSLIDHDAGKFVQVYYTMLMSLKLVGEYGNQETAAERRAFLLRMFRAFYGEGNIWYEENTDRYCFYQKKSVIGILNEVSPQWTFLSYQPGTELDRFIPADVLLLMQPPPAE